MAYWQKQGFYHALTSGNREVMERSIDEMPDWMYGVSKWDTPLIWLIRNGYPDLAIRLLDRGGNSNEFDYYHTISVLHIAVRQESSEDNAALIRKLLEKGSEFDKVVVRHGTPLMAAINARNIPAVEILLKRGASAPPWMKRLAVDSGDEEILSAVLKGQSMSRSTDSVKDAREDRTQGHLQEQLLVSRIRNALDERSDPEVVELLEEAIQSIEPNQLGSLYRHVLCHRKWAVASWLIEHDVRPASSECETCRGRCPRYWDFHVATPLMLALREERFDLARDLILLSRSYDQQSRGKTALTLAIEKLRPDLAELLIERGANIHAGGEAGYPLMAAATSGDAATARVLLRKGYDEEKSVESLNKALDRQLDVAWALLDAGVKGTCESVNIAGTYHVDNHRYGIEATISDTRNKGSFEKGRVEIVSALLEGNADPNCLRSIIPTGELTLLMKIAIFDNEFYRGEGIELTKALVEGGADPDIVSVENYTGEEQTALSFAILKGHIEIADYLNSVGAAMP